MLSFDSIVLNTELPRGACALLEQKNGEKILKLACRYHILQIKFQKVVVKLFEVSNEPDILLIK